MLDLAAKGVALPPADIAHVHSVHVGIVEELLAVAGPEGDTTNDIPQTIGGHLVVAGPAHCLGHPCGNLALLGEGLGTGAQLLAARAAVRRYQAIEKTMPSLPCFLRKSYESIKQG